MIVQEKDNHGISIVNIGGNGNASNQLSSPHGIEFDKITNTLYIGDYGNHRIMVYANNATNGIVAFGGQNAGLNRTQLYNPVGIYLDYISNSLLIANYGVNNVVRWIRSERQWILMAGNINGIASNSSTTLRGVTDMIFDPMGNMYVADRNNQRIQLFMPGESIGKTIADTTYASGINASVSSGAFCVKLDNQLNLYVADSRNHRIQKFLRY